MGLNLECFQINLRYGVVGTSSLCWGVWGATPRNFLKINPSFLQCGALCGSFDEILKGYFLYNFDGQNLECLSNKSEVWCSRGIVLMFGGMGATPRKIFKKLPLFPAI